MLVLIFKKLEVGKTAPNLNILKHSQMVFTDPDSAVNSLGKSSSKYNLELLSHEISLQADDD